jgi:hypothetical protein
MLALVVADALMRVLLRERLYVRPTIMFLNPWPKNEALQRYERNLRYRGEMYGDLAVIHGDPAYRDKRQVRFETDEAGFRNAPGSRRRENSLILLGDSFGAGSGGSQEATLSYVLGERHRITNYNLSVGAATPWQEVMTLKQELPKIRLAPQAGLVWLLFSGNDLDSSFSDELEIRQNDFFKQTAVKIRVFYKRSPIRQLLQPHADQRQLVEIKSLGDQRVLFYAPYIARAGRTKKQIVGHQNYKAFERLVEHTVAWCASRHLRLYVVLVPSKPETYSWALDDPDETVHVEKTSGLSDVLQQWSERAGVDFLDLLPQFVQVAKAEYKERGTLLFWRDDSHWNDRGQEVAAQVISEFLRGLEVTAQWPSLDVVNVNPGPAPAMRKLRVASLGLPGPPDSY